MLTLGSMQKSVSAFRIRLNQRTTTASWTCSRDAKSRETALPEVISQAWKPCLRSGLFGVEGFLGRDLTTERRQPQSTASISNI